MGKFNVNDLMITSLETMMACKPNRGDFLFLLDELQNGTIGNTQQNDPITGRGGRTIGQLKRNKAVTVSGANGIVSLGLIEAEVGTEGGARVAEVKFSDYLVVENNSATTSYTAVGTMGNEIGKVYVKDASGLVVKTLTQDTNASEGKFAYNPAEKKITFNESELEDGTQITVYYLRKIQADAYIENDSEHYSETVELYIDALAKDRCQNVYHVQFYIPYADFDGNFDFAMGDTQTIQNFTATSIASACLGSSSKFWTLTVYGEDAEDVA